MTDERENDEEQVDDLDTPESEAEEVKGGAADIFAKLGDIKGESVAFKYDRGFRGSGWNGGNHNQTLIEL
jgi:hypothetical protein